MGQSIFRVKRSEELRLLTYYFVLRKMGEWQYP